MLVESKKIIIIPNRKTGLMSLVDAISQSNLFAKPEHAHAYAFGTIPFYNYSDYFEEFPDWPGKDYIINQQIIDNNIFYLTARNPFDKMVSSYSFFNNGRDIFGTMMTFDEFVNRLVSEDITFNAKIHTITPSLDFVLFNKNLIDFKPIRFETLYEDFYNLCIENNIDCYKNLRHINKSSARASDDYRPYYNKKTLKIVKTLFEKDIEFFKYKF